MIRVEICPPKPPRRRQGDEKKLNSRVSCLVGDEMRQRRSNDWGYTQINGPSRFSSESSNSHFQFRKERERFKRRDFTGRARPCQLC